MACHTNDAIEIPPMVRLAAWNDDKIYRLVAGIQGIDWSQCHYAVARAQVIWLLSDLEIMLHAAPSCANRAAPLVGLSAERLGYGIGFLDFGVAVHLKLFTIVAFQQR